MAWKIELSDVAKKQLSKLDKPIAKRITDFLLARVARLTDPRSLGEALVGKELGAYWKYRVGDFRLICDIQDNELLILVIRVGDRKEIYRKR